MYNLDLEGFVAGCTYTVKKGSRVFRPQPGVTTKLSLGGSNDVITELFLPRGSLVSDIPAGDGKLVNLFYGVLYLYGSSATHYCTALPGRVYRRLPYMMVYE